MHPRPVPTLVKNRTVQRCPGGQEQGRREVVRQVLSCERIWLRFPGGGEGAGAEAMFILLSYHVVLCMHQNDFYGHARRQRAGGRRAVVTLRGALTAQSVTAVLLLSYFFVCRVQRVRKYLSGQPGAAQTSANNAMRLL